MDFKTITRFCAPSINFMNKLKYPAKIMLLGSLVLAMTCGIIGLLLMNLQGQANFSIKENYGVEYINPLKQLFIGLNEYNLSPNNNTKSSIDKKINEINSIDEKLNKKLKIEDKWQGLKTDLEQISSSKNRVKSAITKTSGLIDYVTNESNLILDPDLDTYYLMDSYCLRFTNIISKIFALKEMGLKKINGGYYNQIEMIKISVLLDEQNEIIKTNTATIYANNEGEKSNLDEYYNNTYTSTKAFLNTINKLISGSRVSAAELTQKANAAINANNQADIKYAQSLHNLAEKRANKYKSQQPISVLITIVSLAIIGYLFAGFYLSLVQSVSEISTNLFHVVEEVESASDKLAESSQILAEGNLEQAAAIQETASTLDESSSMVNQNTENTKAAAILATQAKGLSQKGSSDMTEMMSSMEELKNSSNQIAKIIKVIDEIAFQTNLLSLNAAVEAARAGDAGKGFAVVAEEVRNLAQRSAEAAKDTAAIIESNIHLSAKGVQAAQKTAQVLSDIDQQVQKVSEIIDEVAVATQEQNMGVMQINSAMMQMSVVTENNSNIAENNASAVEELSIQAKNMKVVVNGLISLINGVDSGQNQTLISSNEQRKFISKKY